jgi:hypothetical protein
MAHGIFPSYGLQWIKSGQFNGLTKSEKVNCFFKTKKSPKADNTLPAEEEADLKINRRKK